MKIKIDKCRLKTHFAYYWWVYPLIAAIAIFIGRFIFDLVSKPDKSTVFSVSVFAGGCDEDKLRESLEAAFEDSKVKNINIFAAKPDDNYQKSQLLWARSLDSDIIIVSEDNMFDNIGSVYFAELDGDDKILDYYAEKGKCFGIKLAGSEANGFSDGEQAYLFVTVSGAKRTEEVSRAVSLLCKSDEKS